MAVAAEFWTDRFVVDEKRQLAHLGCNHAFTLSEWREYIHKEFELGRKKPLIALGCLREGCKARMTPNAFRALAGDASCLARFEAMMKTVPATTCPKTLADFNYAYDSEGCLRTLDGGFGFHFVSQQHYDALGDIIVRHLQLTMMREYRLIEHKLPEGADPDGPKNNIFVSADWQTCDVLLLIIQGSGAVRPGQWARALCINDSIHIGSILPYLEEARSRHWGVMVFNPNQTKEFYPDEKVSLSFLPRSLRHPTPLCKHSHCPLDACFFGSTSVLVQSQQATCRSRQFQTRAGTRESLQAHPCRV
jgi:hypothetical protein